jgi:hypothetical protein
MTGNIVAQYEECTLTNAKINGAILEGELYFFKGWQIGDLSIPQFQGVQSVSISGQALVPLQIL